MLKNSSPGYVCCTVGFFYWYCARYASNFSELADSCNANIFIKVLNSPTEVIAFDRVEYCIICKKNCGASLVKTLLILTFVHFLLNFNFSKPWKII
jgi:hypothetical protein